MTQQMQDALKLAPVELEQFVANTPDSDLEEIEHMLERIADQAAFVAAYIAMRRGYGGNDQGHARAAKEANKAHKAVRRLFGYTLTHDIHF